MSLDNNVRRIKKNLDKAQKKIEILERIVEDRSREMYFKMNELQDSEDRLSYFHGQIEFIASFLELLSKIHST